MFYLEKSIYILYTENYITKIPDKEELKQIVDEIKEAGMDIIE